MIHSLTRLTAATAIATAAGVGAALAQDYPSQPITVAACYGAGGGVDRNLRMVERVAQQHLGQTILVEYVLGGSGSVAMQHVADADPDGYQLTMCDNGGAIIAPIAQGLDFDASSVTPIAQVLFQPWFLTARVGSPYESVEDIVEAAKAGGDQIPFEISDIATSDHYGFLLFADAAGLDFSRFKWSPHGGGGEKMRAIMAGEGDLLNDDAGEIEQHVRAGTLKPLAVMSPVRHPSFPDVPTMRELGYDVVAGQQIALFAPADIPEERAEALREAMRNIAKDPVLISAFEATLQDPATFIVDGFEETWARDWDTARTLLQQILN